MVICRVSRLQESGAIEAVGRHVDGTKAQDIGIEANAFGHVADVQDGVIKAVYWHYGFLGLRQLIHQLVYRGLTKKSALHSSG